MSGFSSRLRSRNRDLDGWSMTPLEAYRRAQQDLRREFDPLTRKLCAQCPTPCCRTPARVTPADIVIARMAGWNPPDELTIEDAIALAADQAGNALDVTSVDRASGPCPFLRQDGCLISSDLRPHGCTQFVCPYMLAELDARRRARLRRKLALLRRTYEALLPRASSASIKGGRTRP